MAGGNKKGNTSYATSPGARSMMRNLAINIRALRQAHGWSQQELGKRTGIGWRVIANWEDELNAPSFIAVCWLAEAFDVTLNQLIFYPREAFDGRMQSTRNGRFIVPNAPRTRRNRDTSTETGSGGITGPVHTPEIITGERDGVA